MSTSSTETTQTTQTQNGAGKPADGTGGTPTPETVQNPSDADHGSEGDTFSRAYVEQLRQENAAHRTNSKKADELARRLVSAFAESTGRLHNASDVPFSDDLLDDDGYPDPEKVEAAVTALIESKPYLGKIKLTGTVGQGVTSEEKRNDLSAFGDVLRNAAG